MFCCARVIICLICCENKFMNTNIFDAFNRNNISIFALRIRISKLTHILMNRCSSLLQSLIILGNCTDWIADFFLCHYFLWVTKSCSSYLFSVYILIRLKCKTCKMQNLGKEIWIFIFFNWKKYFKLFYFIFPLKVWPEVTDPEKFVYEDVAIATYLLVRSCFA